MCSLFHCLSERRVGGTYALRVSPAVTRLTVYRRPQVGLPVLRICLVSGAVALYVVLYMYILEFLPSGMSIAALDMLLPESFTGAEGKTANTTPYKSGVNDRG